MALAIRGVNNFIKKILLSNYSLTTQIIIINLLTATIGFIFLFLFNYFLLSNNKSLDDQIDNIQNDLFQITNYLSDNSIIRIPQFNEKKCENNASDERIQCGDIILSNPQLDPTSTQKYLFDNYINQTNIIKVYDESWIKFADTEDMYISSDVVEIDIEKPTKKPNLYIQYKKNYLKYFNYFQQYFIQNKIQPEIRKYQGDNFLVRETIKKQSNLSYLYKDNSENIVLINSSPIVNNDNIYGVVLVSGLLNKENDETGLISFNLINLFLIIIFIMFFLSILFSQSIVFPIKTLSKIVRFERDKSNKNLNEFVYPKRLDEIGILSNDIRSMSEDLKKRIYEIETFAADVSHELKNPLASLKSSNELLVNDKISDEKKSLLLKNIQNDIERMNTLITDISSYTLTQIEIDEELFYSFDLVDFIIEFLKSYSLNSKDIKINFEFEKKPSMIYANKDKLAQVFVNIIDNSLSYSPHKSEILIHQKIVDRNVVVLVSDQGNGISNDLSTKIFERFYTDRSSEKNKHSGLGLSIVKKIIESFSGSIKLTNLKSEKYFGACFEITLPLKD